jgi:hypothetical protein
MEKESVEFVDISVIRKQLVSAGRCIKHLTRNLRRAGYTLHRVNGRIGRNLYALTKADAERYILEYGQLIAEEAKPVKESLRSVEERVRSKRETEGWISLRLSSAGMPDLINLKPRGDGSFEVLFEEVKGPGDGLKKDQHAVLESMKQKGISSVVTWL